MKNYKLSYTAAEGNSGYIYLDGTGEEWQKKSETYGSGLSPLEDGIHAIQVEYDCAPEEWLDLYLKAKLYTHIYRLNLQTGEKKALFEKNRPYPMVYGGSTLIYDGSYLCSVISTGGTHNSVWLSDEDGNQWIPLTPPEEATVYGIHLNSTKDQIAFHVTSPVPYAEVYDYMPHPYSINTIDLRTRKRTLVDTGKNRLLFGPTFSPDDQWLLYVDCHHEDDPGHLFADVCVARPDGSEVRHLTQGQSSYFATAFGPENYRRGGSNCPIWLNAHTVIYSKRSPGAHPDCGVDMELGNHKELYYDPSQAKGGCQLVKIDIDTGAETPITPYAEGKWDFRPTLSPDQEWLAYTCAQSGGKPSSIRACRLDGSEDHHLTYGLDGNGVDFATFMDK